MKNIDEIIQNMTKDQLRKHIEKYVTEIDFEIKLAMTYLNADKELSQSKHSLSKWRSYDFKYKMSINELQQMGIDTGDYEKFYQQALKHELNVTELYNKNE